MANSDNSFYINKAGLALLLDSKGVSELYMLNVFGDEVNIDDDLACKTLFDMVSEQIIIVDGEEFEVCEDADRLISIVANAKVLFSAYSNNDKTENIAIYFNDEGLCMLSPSGNRPNYLKLQEIEYDELFDFVVNHFSIEAPELADEIEKDVYIESLQFLSLDDDFENVISSSKTDLFVCVDQAKNKIPIKRVGVISSSNGKVLASWTKNGVELSPYTKANLKLAICGD